MDPKSPYSRFFEHNSMESPKCRTISVGCLQMRRRRLRATHCVTTTNRRRNKVCYFLRRREKFWTLVSRWINFIFFWRPDWNIRAPVALWKPFKPPSSCSHDDRNLNQSIAGRHLYISAFGSATIGWSACMRINEKMDSDMFGRFAIECFTESSWTQKTKDSAL